MVEHDGASSLLAPCAPGGSAPSVLRRTSRPAPQPPGRTGGCVAQLTSGRARAEWVGASRSRASRPSGVPIPRARPAAAELPGRRMRTKGGEGFGQAGDQEDPGRIERRDADRGRHSLGGRVRETGPRLVRRVPGGCRRHPRKLQRREEGCQRRELTRLQVTVRSALQEQDVGSRNPASVLPWRRGVRVTWTGASEVRPERPHRFPPDARGLPEGAVWRE